MPIPQYILDLRRHIGHGLLYLPGIKARPWLSAPRLSLRFQTPNI